MCERVVCERTVYDKTFGQRRIVKLRGRIVKIPRRIAHLGL